MIPLDAYHLCLTGTGRFWIIAQISLSFAFGKYFVIFLNSPVFELNHIPLDIAVFVLVIVQTRLIRLTHPGVPSILDTVSRDAGIYFAVISSSHFVVVVMYALARVGFFIRALGSIVLTTDSVFSANIAGPSNCVSRRDACG